MLLDWLKERDLQLSEEKTVIVHLKDGIDFLGFHVRQYPSRNTCTGWKTLIKHSEALTYRTYINMITKCLSLSAQLLEVIIKRLSLIIRG
ncbi:hypothetical protein GCM10028809_59850 [Spirosoma gilvum]